MKKDIALTRVCFVKYLLPSLRNPIDGCLRKANAISDFRFEGKINNFLKHFYEEFIWDGCI